MVQIFFINHDDSWRFEKLIIKVSVDSTLGVTKYNDDVPLHYII